MRITFIGTSHGYPEKNRKCTCILLEIGEKKYFLDMGCNPLEYLADHGMHIRDVTAAFISHTHGDHINGIIPITEVINSAFRDATIAFYVPTLAVVDAINGFKAMNGAVLRDSVPFHQITEGVFYDDGVLRVTAYRNGHTACSYSFLFEAEGKTAFFTGDLSPRGAVEEYPQTVKRQYDFVACEGAHMWPIEYREAFEAIPQKQIWFYHYIPGPCQEQILQLREELKAIVPIHLATDGCVVEI